MNEIRYFSMFTGVGGFELGFQGASNIESLPKIEQDGKRRNGTSKKQGTLLRTGHSTTLFTPIGFSEIDKYANELLKNKFPGITNYGDATKIDANKLPEFDLLCGGFPCQAFSIAGKRKGLEDSRGTMFFEIARILRIKRPKYLFLENVKGLLSHESGETKTFELIGNCFQELGYEIQWMVFNSKFFGVPQNRERVFIIGSLRNEPRPKILPFRETSEKTSKPNQIKRFDDQRGRKRDNEAMRLHSDEGISPCVTDGVKDFKYAISNRSPREVGWREDCPTLQARDYKEPKVVAMRWSRTEKGKKFRKDSMKKGSDKTPFSDGHRELVESNEEISGCITNALAKDSLLKQNMKIRKLTPLECERLQGFPDNWTEGFSDTQRYKMMGNAVTVPVIKAIAIRIFK